MNDEAASIAADIAALARSPLFDSSWYEALYPECKAGGGNPLVHFCNTGWRQGHCPNPYFDTDFYLARNTDVREAGLNPLAHYLAYGESEKRWPSLHFDPDWYRGSRKLAENVHCLSHLMQRNAEEEIAPNPAFDPTWYRNTYGRFIPPGQPAFAEFRLCGAAAGRCSSAAHRLIREAALFDEAFYCRTHPSVVESGLEPAYHFCAIGWRQKLQPGPDFDIAWYCAQYADVQVSQINPLFHFLQFGVPEGRLARAETATRETDTADASDAHDVRIIQESQLFDCNFYLINYPDVRDLDHDPLEHFCKFGWREGRRPNPYFDPTWYDEIYLAGSRSCNPLSHYIREGESRSHRPIVYFETDWYRHTYRLSEMISPLQHYLENRRSQVFSPTSHFDIRFYLTKHGSEIGHNRDPFAHFLRAAISRDVNPSTEFDTRLYRERAMAGAIAPDPAVPGAEIHRRLRREKLNPLVHYLLHAENKASVRINKTLPSEHPSGEIDRAYAAIQSSDRRSSCA